jgi:cation diffusion facilitator family transporter
VSDRRVAPLRRPADGPAARARRPDREGWHDETVEPDRESRRTVVVALLANLGIVASKLAAAVVTGSTAMFAETVHSTADAGNSVLLLVAQRRSRRPAPSDGLSRGREAYFWALLAAIGVFFVGAVLAVYEGVRELVNPVAAESFVVAYVVLAIAFLLDLVSFLRARRHLRREAQAMSRGLLEHVRMTSDPTTRAVFAEDAAGLTGNVLAATGIALHQATGSVVPDAVAAIGIGLVLGTVAVYLVERNRDFLVGEEVSPAGKERIRAVIAGWPGVVAIRRLVVTFTGPDEVLVVARVDIDDSLGGAAVEGLVSGIERELRTLEPWIARVEVVPTG